MRARPRPDEAVRVQRRADLALPERPGLPRPDRRARPVRHRRGRHRDRTPSRARCATTTATCRQWVDRVSRMAVRDENHAVGHRSGRSATSPATGSNHEAAAAWLRRYDPIAAAPLRGRDPLRLDRATRASATSTCPMYRRSRRSSTTPGRALQRHPLIMCEFSHAMGNSNGTPGRVLGRDRVDARAPGRVHLGVLGPRPGPDAARRPDALGLRRRLRRRAERRQLRMRRAGLAGPPAEAGHVGAPAGWPRRSASPGPTTRSRAGRSRSRTARHVSDLGWPHGERGDHRRRRADRAAGRCRCRW